MEARAQDCLVEGLDNRFCKEAPFRRRYLDALQGTTDSVGDTANAEAFAPESFAALARIVAEAADLANLVAPAA